MLKKWDIAKVLSVLIFLCCMASEAYALPLSNQCSAGQAVSGISTSDVTGNVGGSSDCFGAFDGTDPELDSDLTYAGTSWAFVSKVDLDGDKQIIGGEDIGMYLTWNSGGTEGTWLYDSDVFSSQSFIIVLKAADTPGWAAYLFDGSDAASSSGMWSVAWSNALSHMSIYSIVSAPSVPEPSPLVLLVLALIVAGVRFKSSHLS